jgi:hypothetical protein
MAATLSCQEGPTDVNACRPLESLPFRALGGAVAGPRAETVSGAG